MKNPSCPDSETNPTFRNMLSYAAHLGAGSLDVVNLFARRTGSAPRDLNQLTYEEAVGPDNDATIIDAADVADRIIVAWGGPSGVRWYKQRTGEVHLLLSDRPLWMVQRPTPTVAPLHPQVWSTSYPLGRYEPIAG